jgi:integrase
LLPEDSRCWTLQYADVVDTIGLKLDVVPSSHEDAERIRHLIELGIEQEQASQAIGRPIEASVINRGFSKLIKDNNLPKVVFHSLRHSSITYKLKLNGGDMKSVQGDSGHAQLKMIEDVYSHIIDEDRCVNAQRFETEFYEQHKHKTEEAPEANAAESTAGKAEKDKETLLRLLQNPEMAKLLKTIAASL